ncbi:hypothetical protein ACFY12_07465 [Streptomyces sp. NPDC001339]|uniref:hypothetical protein n=1 Tax=Streptomyces sp. NPDC001339 TaxID=3364563 RepID=UPI0036B6D56F
MSNQAINIEQLMERLGDSGVTILLKVDHERTAERRKPWTIVMSGPSMGEGEFLHTDCHTLDNCLEYGLGELRAGPGDWKWLDGLNSVDVERLLLLMGIQAIIDIEQLMERLGDSGVTICLKIDHERTAERCNPWAISMSGPGVGNNEGIYAEFRTLADCLEYGLGELRARPGDWKWLDELF